ncbi:MULTISPECIES: hypothetical protein [unclassified Sphingobacterium]|uniref:hypothetical protein n=1 Tax=unclassified Sphingobacterium TaxID=2609468 RepID=UPI0025CFC2A7|nr:MULTISPECIES: hypothetical protein [unclassified Sphingobacterium]
MKIITRHLLCLFLLLNLTFCGGSSQKQDNEMIWLVFQPTVELNKSVTLRLFFKNKPETGSIKVHSATKDAYEKLDGSEIEREMESQGDLYVYDITFEAGSLGKSNLPIIEAKIAGKIYKSSAAVIEVVEKQDVNINAVKLVLETDKDRYNIDDTIRLVLYEYSKFSQISKFTPADLVEKGAPEALFAIIDSGNVDYEVGIPGFKKLIDANFNVANYDWNVNDIGKRMATLDGQLYIKNRIFNMKMTAKEKGIFTIPQSRFDYKIYPYEEAFKEELLGPDETLRTKNKVLVQSDSLKIIVE